MTNFFVIPEDAQPRKNLWILGDGLLDSVGDHLLRAIQDQPESLYLTKNYQIKVFSKDHHNGFFSNNFITRIANTVVTALNAGKIILPSEMLIILDNQFLKEDYFAEVNMPKLIEKLFDELLQTIRQRKKQTGYAYWSDHEPRVLLLRPTPRPAYSLVDQTKYKARKRLYCQQVEEVCAKYRVTFLNVDELNSSQRVLFDEYGNLSPYGAERLWKSISDYFRRSDRDEYYAIKKYRTHKKSVATQTFTQQSTLPQVTPKQQVQQQQLPSNHWQHTVHYPQAGDGAQTHHNYNLPNFNYQAYNSFQH